VGGDEHRLAGRDIVGLDELAGIDAGLRQEGLDELAVGVAADLGQHGGVGAEPAHRDGRVHRPAAAVDRDAFGLHFRALLEQQERGRGIVHRHALDVAAFHHDDDVDHRRADADNPHEISSTDGPDPPDADCRRARTPLYQAWRHLKQRPAASGRTYWRRTTDMAKSDKKPKQPQYSPTQLNIGYFLVALMAILVFQAWWSYREIEQIPYSVFQQLLDEGRIAEVEVSDNSINGRYVEPRDGRSHFVTNRVDPELSQRLEDAGVEFTGAMDTGWFATLLSWILPMLLILAVWLFIFRKMAEKQGFGGLMNVGKSKAKVYVETDTGVTFDDVAGIDEAKVELQEIVSFLNDKDKYGRLGARIPKGILLVGPPGTGKTLIARAVAGEAGVPFFSISGSEFVEMFVGVGAARVRDLFEQARKAAPCIIFIDELDALGKARSGIAQGGGNDEKEQTLNQLLAELDGFDPREGIVLLAATNRPEILDPALLRAGRFDRQVVVDRPERKGREAILRVHLKKIKVEPGLDLERIAAITPGFTGADLANLANEAAIVATRRGAKRVSLDDFTAAVERIVAGSEKKSRLLSPREREIVAYHEMGHALAAASLPSADPVHKVSIIPRSIGRSATPCSAPPRTASSSPSATSRSAWWCSCRAARRKT
jgi:cell division protease FtsH